MKQRNKQNQLVRDRIVSAMMELTRRKPISAVTVQELTEQADVSRMTFYRNYTSKEDVFISRIEEILEQYRRDDPDRKPGESFFDRNRIRHGFSYFYQYKDFVSTLIGCGLSDIFLHRLTEFAMDMWLRGREDRVEQYRLVTFVGLMFNSFLTWIQPSQSMSLEELTDLVASICERAYRERE